MTYRARFRLRKPVRHQLRADIFAAFFLSFFWAGCAAAEVSVSTAPAGLGATSPVSAIANLDFRVQLGQTLTLRVGSPSNQVNEMLFEVITARKARRTSLTILAGKEDNSSI